MSSNKYGVKCKCNDLPDGYPLTNFYMKEITIENKPAYGFMENITTGLGKTTTICHYINMLNGVNNEDIYADMPELVSIDEENKETNDFVINICI